ncbi:hypothetical protein [Defluviimonas sp. SAOS-178_SWC]|uniref:hypothetical protein n=1 Tax=Defluviimonas sp. SAOS-178_SWC TaxID=3121287 RepID=UPI003221EC73
MLIDFISTIAAGFGAAGVVLILNRLSGRRLPKWALPAAVGAAMLSFTIWNEYTWYPRVRAQLPETVTIATAPADRAVWRPWSYVFPLVTRFVAVDKTEAVHSTTQPDMFVASAVVIRRWTASERLPVAFDCAKGLRADLFEGAELAENGTLKGAEWRPHDPEDALVRAACNGG